MDSSTATAMTAPFIDPTDHVNLKTDTDASENRRMGNYKPSIWNYDFLQSLATHHNIVEERHLKLAEKLKGQVKFMFGAPMEPLAKLELVDVVQRLGLNHLFETEIKEALFSIYKDGSNGWWFGHLHATSLRFRLLRQCGLFIPQDVFKTFQNKTGEFDMKLCDNVKGLLSLYEASYLGWKGENILDEAKAFTTKCLKSAWENISEKWLAKRVKHALALPLHWRVPRIEARWFIEAYEQEANMNPTLLKLAKLDFNMVQSIHQKEIGELARWWVTTGLDKLAFARNNLLQSYMWSCAIASDPKFKLARETIVEIGSVLAVVDDGYDVYGSIDELDLYTSSVERWSCVEIDKLPNTLKLIFMSMFNKTNEVGLRVQHERGYNSIPTFIKAWVEQCKSYQKEARWFHGGHTPPLEEYSLNGLVSIGFPLLLITGYVAIAENEAALDKVHPLPDLLHYSSLLSRLINDIGTSPDEMARGDNLKSIHCYMNETGASEEVAREHIKGVIEENWKILNQCCFDQSQFQEPFITFNLNSVRGSHFFFEFGDGFGVTDSWTKVDMKSVLIDPIPLGEE
nr:santalene synthase mutant 12 [synthetic construct]